MACIKLRTKSRMHNQLGYRILFENIQHSFRLIDPGLLQPFFLRIFWCLITNTTFDGNLQWTLGKNPLQVLFHLIHHLKGTSASALIHNRLGRATQIQIHLFIAQSLNSLHNAQENFRIMFQNLRRKWRRWILLRQHLRFKFPAKLSCIQERSEIVVNSTIILCKSFSIDMACHTLKWGKFDLHILSLLFH